MTFKIALVFLTAMLAGYVIGSGWPTVSIAFLVVSAVLAAVAASMSDGAE